MYHSRLYFTNGIISFELDALNGEPLAFVREDTCDNARKNHICERSDVIDGEVWMDGKTHHLNIPRYAEIRRDPALTPKIKIDQRKGEAKAEILYPYLVTGGKRVDISAHVTIHLPKDSESSLWDLTLENKTENEVLNVSFPELGGLWLGDSWEDDIAVLPRISGAKIENPTRVISSKPTVITWKWQEYLHKYRTDRNGVRDDRGIWYFRSPYTGGGSMLWMDLYNKKENRGIYLSARDPEMRLADVHISTLGEHCPGVGIGVLHHPCMKKGTWKSPQGILAFHEGDWHWAADTYRAMREGYGKPVLKGPSRPDWFHVSTGLAAHYDFRYQGGGIVHRFEDIPALFEKAKTWGLDHLFLAGWNEDGFDFGFPHYQPDPELGGAEELKKALDKVHEMGGHVTFYVNSRLCNVDFEDQKKRIEKSAIMRRDGSLRIENYGAGDVKFASLCMNEKEWREEFAEDIRYLLQDMGADGIYLDQLAMTLGMTCYHPGHDHHPAAWNQGYETLLETIREENPGKAIFYEGCCDIFGSGVTAQLISTLRQVRDGVTPEIYRYTFPDQVLLDMENPRRHSGMRPEHVARKATFFLYRGFVCGLYFWVYDLEEDNTFDRDPEQLERLRRACALRRIWLERYGFGTFRDWEGLVNVSETDLVKRFDLLDGRVLVAAAEEKGLSGTLSFLWEKENALVTVYSDRKMQGEILDIKAENGVLSLPLPEGELALLVVE